MQKVPKICVVIPAYNHEKFIGDAILSVDAQNIPGVELRVLDDGSADGTVRAAEEAIRQCRIIHGTVDTQENRGCAATLNRLIESADADYVAVLNSDDFYGPDRLRTLLRAAKDTKLFFGFTGVEFHKSAAVSDFVLFEDWYRSKFTFCGAMPTCGFALLAANIAITSSNFFFDRELFELAGGFEPELTLTQDWQFAIKVLRWAEPYLIPKRLLCYRVHADNTYRKLYGSRIEQSKQALDAFVDWADERTLNEIAPTHQNWPLFFQYFVRTCAPAFSVDPIGKFLPDHFLNFEDGKQGREDNADSAAVTNLLAISRELKSEPNQSTATYLERAARNWESNR